MRLLQPGGGVEPLALIGGLEGRLQSPIAGHGNGIGASHSGAAAAVAVAGAAGSLVQRLAGGWAPRPDGYLASLRHG